MGDSPLRIKTSWTLAAPNPPATWPASGCRCQNRLRSNSCLTAEKGVRYPTHPHGCWNLTNSIAANNPDSSPALPDQCQIDSQRSLVESRRRASELMRFGLDSLMREIRTRLVRLTPEQPPAQRDQRCQIRTTPSRQWWTGKKREPYATS